MGFFRRPCTPVAILLLVSADQFTKYLVQARLAIGQVGFVLKGGFGIKYVVNRSVALVWFSFAHPHARIINIAIVVFALALIGIVLSFSAFRFGGDRLTRIAFILAWGGLLGTLTDHIFLPYARDFLVLPGWPIFNLADVFCVAGVFFFLTSLLLNPAARAQFNPKTPKNQQVTLRDIVVFVKKEVLMLARRR